MEAFQTQGCNMNSMTRKIKTYSMYFQYEFVAGLGGAVQTSTLSRDGGRYERNQIYHAPLKYDPSICLICTRIVNGAPSRTRPHTQTHTHTHAHTCTHTHTHTHAHTHTHTHTHTHQSCCADCWCCVFKTLTRSPDPPLGVLGPPLEPRHDMQVAHVPHVAHVAHVVLSRRGKRRISTARVT